MFVFTIQDVVGISAALFLGLLFFYVWIRSNWKGRGK